MDVKIAQWDIWLADFPYEEDKSKFSSRPVIVLSVSPLWIMSIKVTTHSPRISDKFDVEIKHWKESGLDKPSTARISKYMNLSGDKFKVKLGKLHPDDRRSVMESFYNFTNL